MSKPSQMDQFGSELSGGSDAVIRRRNKSIKRGECPTCKRKTHRVPLIGKREALTIPGEVINGICLRCNPIEGYATRPAQHAPAIPNTLEVMRDDDVSEITMDPNDFLPAPHTHYGIGGGFNSGGFHPGMHGNPMQNHYEPRTNFGPILEESPMTEFGGGEHPQTTNETAVNLSEEQNANDGNMGNVGNVRSQPRAPAPSASANDARALRQEKLDYVRSLCWEQRGGVKVEVMPENHSPGAHFENNNLPPSNAPQNAQFFVTNSHTNGLQSNTNYVTPPASHQNPNNPTSSFQHPGGPQSTHFPDSNVQSFHNNNFIRSEVPPPYSAQQTQFSAINSLPKNAHQSNPLHHHSIHFAEDTIPSSAGPQNTHNPNESHLHGREPTIPHHNIASGALPRPKSTSTHSSYLPHGYMERIDSMDDEYKEAISVANLSEDATLDEVASVITGVRQSQLSHVEGVDDLSEGSEESKASGIKFASVKDIPVILKCVRVYPTVKCTERAFQTLFLLSTEPGPNGALARSEILAHDGMEMLVAAIWKHMDKNKLLVSLFYALWGITIYNQNDATGQNSIRKIQECRGLEALLFAMQTNMKDLAIQEAGCDLINRLASLLPRESAEFKSATVMICNNMWCMDPATKAFSTSLLALNCLCQLSDENKREFAKSGSECFGSVSQALLNTSLMLDVRELACQLFWCVTSDLTSVSILSSEAPLVNTLLDVMRSLPHHKTSIPLYEAACGTLANLALDPPNHDRMVENDVLSTICQGIMLYKHSEAVLSESCSVLANLSSTQSGRTAIMAADSVHAIFSSMKFASDSAEVQCEALRALNNLCEFSLEAKTKISSDLQIITTTFFRHVENDNIQLLICCIFAKLGSEEKSRISMTSMSGTFDALAKMMKLNPSNRLIQTNSCSSLRNLSKDGAIIPILLNRGFVSLVSEAMNADTNAEELQEHGCNFFKNLASYSSEVAVEVCSGGAISAIVKVMQSLPTSASVQKASCSALYAIIYESKSHKEIAASFGAIDAVVCLLLVHPNEVGVLKNAVKVLASLSTLKMFSKQIVQAGGIGTVVESMRSNSFSSGLIIAGSRFLQNMTLSDPNHAEEAVAGITPILACMKSHPNKIELIETSCNSLKCLVSHSDLCKDRVIVSDGIAVIERIIEENKNIPSVNVCTNSLLDILLH